MKKRQRKLPGADSLARFFIVGILIGRKKNSCGAFLKSEVELLLN